MRFCQGQLCQADSLCSDCHAREPLWSRIGENAALICACCLSLRDEVAKPYPNLHAIAAEIRAMKRLWEGKNEDALLTRRDSSRTPRRRTRSRQVRARALPRLSAEGEAANCGAHP